MSLLGTIQLRDAQQIHLPDASDERFQHIRHLHTNQRVNIRHPGYAPDFDLLLRLYSLDHLSGGIHYGVVHDACAIIADNRHDGYLSTDRAGMERIYGQFDDILKTGDYWYHVPCLDPIWPVVTCFRDWRFPPMLPLSWMHIPEPAPVGRAPPSAFSAAILARDATCRISAHSTGTEVAHICPRQDFPWFAANNMARWNNDASLAGLAMLDDHSNLLLMRSDIHKAFDDGDFVLYPKSASGFSLHMIQPSQDLGFLYHNALCHDISKCQPEFLYARFARTLFPFLSTFLAMPIKRNVVVADAQDETRSSQFRTSVEVRDNAMLSRSRSPKKRKAPSVDTQVLDNDITYKRSRLKTSSSGTPPPLETDAGTHLRPSQSSADRYNPITNKEALRMQHLREEALRTQRPPGFEPFASDPFEDTSDAKTVLERMGFDILEDP